MRESRTYWDLTLTMGIPFSRWGAEPFISHPLPFPASGGKELAESDEEDTAKVTTHPFELARRWKEEIENDNDLTKAGIAEREGISRARVTQIMNLLALPELIQHTLKNPPRPFTIDVFPERRLRALLSEEGPTARLAFWNQWLLELKAMLQS